MSPPFPGEGLVVGITYFPWRLCLRGITMVCSRLPGSLHEVKSCACLPACISVSSICQPYARLSDAYLCLPYCNMHWWLWSCDWHWRTNLHQYLTSWVVFVCTQSVLPTVSGGRTRSRLQGKLFSLTCLGVHVSPSERDGWWWCDVKGRSNSFQIWLT